MLYSIITSLSLLLSASVAHAGVIVDVQYCQARILDPNGTYNDSTGDNNFINRSSYCTTVNVSSPLSGTISDSVIETLPNPYGITLPVARASYAARGDNGNLGLRVDTWAAMPSTNPYSIVSDAAAYVILTVNDRITVTSTTLATGARVTIDVSGYLEGRALGNILNNTDNVMAAGSYSVIQSGFEILEVTSTTGTYGARGGFGGCFGFNVPEVYHCNGGDGDFFDAYSQMLEVPVGSTLIINSYLHGISYSGVVGEFKQLEGRSEAEAMNTFSTYLTPVTEGVQLLAESGHDYSRVPTAVPEPGTLVLLGLGCFVLMFIQRTTSHNGNQLRRTGS